MTSARSSICAEVLAEVGDGEDIIATITEHVPTYAALSATQLQETRQITIWAITRVLDLWAQDAEMTDFDVQRFRGIGAARALDGRPLPAVLRAYRLAGARLMETIERIGGSRLTATDAMALARLWMTTIDTLSEALSAGHSAAADRLINDRQQAVHELLEGLLLGRHVTRTGLADRGRELGLRVPSPALLLLVAPAPGGAQITEEAFERLVDELLADHATRALARVRSGVGVIVLPTGTAPAPTMLETRSWRGAHMGEVTIAGLPRAFRLLSHLLAHAPERAFEQRSLLGEPDAQVVGLLTGHSDAEASRLQELVLAPLHAHSEAHLTEGLQAYLSTGSATEAAALLGVHAQTMRYRLRRLRDLTGRDPRRPWDRLVFEAASFAHSASSPGAGL